MNQQDKRCGPVLQQVSVGVGRRSVSVWMLGLFALVVSVAVAVPAGAVVVTAVGEVTQMVEDRVTLDLLRIETPGASETATGAVVVAPGAAPLKIGDEVVFTLPQNRKLPKKQQIRNGNVVRCTLEGALTTEYEPDEEDATASQPVQVYVWTAQNVEKVKNPNDYLSDDKKSRRGKRGKRDRKKKEPPKVWTQEETLRGKITFNRNKMFIQESRVSARKNDRGLQILDERWREKLAVYVDHDVVVSGTTHRTSLSSGTIDIKNILRVGH